MSTVKWYSTSDHKGVHGVAGWPWRANRGCGTPLGRQILDAMQIVIIKRAGAATRELPTYPSGTGYPTPQALEDFTRLRSGQMKILQNGMLIVYDLATGSEVTVETWTQNGSHGFIIKGMQQQDAYRVIREWLGDIYVPH